MLPASWQKGWSERMSRRFKSKWIDMTCKEKLTSNAVPCMPPFSVGETNPLQCLSMFDWHASVQHQSHLWPFAFGPLCQKLLQHICCFQKPLLFSSQSDQKMLLILTFIIFFFAASDRKFNVAIHRIRKRSHAKLKVISLSVSRGFVGVCDEYWIILVYSGPRNFFLISSSHVSH